MDGFFKSFASCSRADSCHFLKSIRGARQTRNSSHTVPRLCYRGANAVLFYGFPEIP